ncbi:MAG: recombinase XerC, partial [Alphaproteobacteria bacterium]|nr:recombinase XerC [Alphaproteobacteria bacterium]
MAGLRAVETIRADTGVRDAITDWATWLGSERRAAANTLAAYRRDLAVFFAFLSEHIGSLPALGDLEVLRAADVRAYMAHERARGLTGTSVARALSTLRGFFRHLERRGLVRNAAVAGVRSPKVPRAIPKPLTVDAARGALAAAA